MDASSGLIGISGRCTARGSLDCLSVTVPTAAAATAVKQRCSSDVSCEPSAVALGRSISFALPSTTDGWQESSSLSLWWGWTTHDETEYRRLTTIRDDGFHISTFRLASLLSIFLMMMMKLPILPCAEKLETSFVYCTKTWNNTDRDSKNGKRSN